MLGFSPSDLLGTLGVALLLAAYLLSLRGRLDVRGAPYLAMNLAGATLAAIAAALIPSWPFVVLEGTWAVVSGAGLLRKRPQPGS